MFIEFNKFTMISYFTMSIILSLVGRRWIYGTSLLILSIFIFIQKQILSSSQLLEYQNLTQLFPYFTYFYIIGISIFVLIKSSIKVQRKLLSFLFLFLSLGFNLVKNKYSEKEMFQSAISSYASCMLFIVFLWTVGFIDDNQTILKNKYDEIKDKLEKF